MTGKGRILRFAQNDRRKGTCLVVLGRRTEYNRPDSPEAACQRQVAFRRHPGGSVVLLEASLRVNVLLLGELGKMAKARPVSVEVPDGANLRQAILELDRCTSTAVSMAILVDGARIASAYSVLRNGSNVLLGRGLDTVLADGDEITIMPKVAGGIE